MTGCVLRGLTAVNGVWNGSRLDYVVNGQRSSFWIRHLTLMVALLLAASALALQAEEPGVDEVIASVEHRYNRSKTLSVEFTETYTVAGRGHRPETGVLVLKKPGRMRWTYSQPAGKLFVSDGRDVYLFTASDNRVEHSTLKASDDIRAPLAFLLGKLDLKKEFRNFSIRPLGDRAELVADARTDRLPYRRVRMVVGRDGSIGELTVDGRDGSTLGYVFRNEVLNPPVQQQSFQFSIPPGADVVEAVTAASGEN